MCKYCEGGKLMFRKNTCPKTSLDSNITEVSIEGAKLKFHLFKSHYDPNELDFDGDWGVFITDYDIDKKIPIKYCPMCGKKLIKKDIHEKETKQ